ncbi:Inner membrane protein YbjJ [Hartmannibacter diazotrophicus]|uniref:Inner membrane protein YbjJ n=1 Tax=Hartmannibacter diazotrophicus TaxID=1482074 RepID=A0A2C9DBG1_9HYPH|nr:MFS transporter [Hartmannibacter diazotrophicus]SON57672.1 Inner membrane protein YbjJ [Hartmannibacter diazotrophicus]
MTLPDSSAMTAPRFLTPRTATVAMFFANGFGIGNWAVSLPLIKDAAGLDAARFSLVLLGLAVGAVVSMPLSGLLLPRLGGSGRATGAAAIAFSLLLALPTLLASLPTLVANTLVLGAASGLMDVSMNAHASTIERRHGRPIMSSFHAAFSAGGLVGALFGGAYLGVGLPSPLLLPVAAIVCLFLVLATKRHLGEGEPPREADAARPRFRINRAILGLGLLAFVFMVVEGAMADWSAVFLTTIHEASPAEAAMGFAAFSITMLAGRLTGDWTLAVFGTVKVLVIGSLAVAGGLALAAASPDALAAGIGFALVGIGAANMVPVAFSLAGKAGPAPEIGISAVATLGYGGFLAGPPMIGWIAAHFSLPDAFWLLAGAAALMGVANLAARTRA